MPYELLPPSQPGAGRYEVLPPAEPSLASRIGSNLLDLGKSAINAQANVGAGALRGAGSIGATILAPIDAAARYFNDGKPVNIGGIDIAGQDRRPGMTQALGSLGADTDSFAFGAGKLGAEIAGTAGVGGLLAKPFQALAASRLGSGLEPALEGIARGLQTGGFRVGELAGTGAGAAARIGAGATVGGASAGLVNPEDASTGAVIGGALPGIAQVGGRIGRALRPSADAGMTAQKLAAARQGAQAGYVIPPADLQPGMGTELLSGLSGKIKTAQVASQRNQVVTDRLVRNELGLGADDALTTDVLQNIRNQAAQAYAPVKQAGLVNVDSTFTKALDNIEQAYQGANSAFPGLSGDGVANLVKNLRVNQFESNGAVDALKVLRQDADKAFRAGDKGLGKAYKEAADAVEGQLERHLTSAGNTGALDALRDARKLIAKTYSVQKALNDQTGSVAAPELAKQLAKGRPLSGDLLTVAQMAQAFPKANQALKETPKAVSPLDWFGALGATGLTQNPLPMAGLLARPAARSYLLSGGAQRAALRDPRLANPNEFGLLTQSGYRVAPLLAGQD